MVTDVEIVITDQTRPLSQRGFGLPLIFGTTKAHPYTEYTSLSAVAEDFDATDAEYLAAQAMFRQSPSPSKVAIYSIARDMPTEGDLASALNDLTQQHNDWYWLVYAPRDHEDGDLEALADWVSAAGKFAVVTNAPGASTDDIVAQAQAMNTSRVVYIAHTSSEDYPDAALVGRMAPLQPGSATFKFKTLDGVTESTFSTTEISQLHDAGVITYVSKFGVLQTSEGYVTDKTFADIQLAKDWLKARMEERISRVLFVNEKIPYDNIGIAQIVDPIRSTLQQATALGIVARADDGTGLFTVRAPRREDVDPTDRANRILPDVYWDAVLAGAVHRVRVSGVVRV
jgi:hypothetical protein